MPLMDRNLLSIATALLLYQGLYYCHLLCAHGIYTAQWATTLFSLQFLTRHYALGRALLVLLLLALHYGKLAAFARAQQGGRVLVTFLGYALAAFAFVALDAWLAAGAALWVHPLLLVLLSCLPLCKALPKGATSLKQPTVWKSTEWSIALPTQAGILPINNPQRGIYVLGNQGSGKSRFVVEPLLYHFIKQGYAGLIYDYDFEGLPADAARSYCLTKFAYNCFLKHKAPGMSFQLLNFADLTRTYRINPVAPRFIQNRAYLEEYLDVLLRNLNAASAKTKDFWINSTKALLKGLLVFLSNKHPQYCSLPHAVSLAVQPIDKVLEAMGQDEEAVAYASSIFDAMEAGDKAAGQLAGILATFKVSLQLLLDPHIFWVLSGHDISLSINEKDSPTILCMGNYPPARAAYSPILALLITVCFKAMYGHNRLKSFVMIDELPTLLIPDLSELPATGRKYGISTVACVQSNAQLEHTYGAVGAKRIEQTLVNKFLGNCEGDSAAFASRLMGKGPQEVASFSASMSVQEGKVSESQGKSAQQQDKEVLSAQAFMAFEVGEFAGKVAESDATFFHTKLQPVSAYAAGFENPQLQELPALCKEVGVLENFRRIQKEAQSVVS